MKTMTIALLALLLLSHGWAQLSGVYAVSDAQMIKRTWINPSQKTDTANHVWNNSNPSISIFGGKNETVAFQLILENSSSNPVTSVNVSLPYLSNGTTTIQNSSSDPTAFIGRYIELFVVSYDSITGRTFADGNEWVPESMAQPDSLWTGLIPDALIPFEAPVKTPAHGMGGAPFAIPAHRNQSVWCDIYIPKSATAGSYSGTMSVTVNGSQVYSIPLNLAVYNFSLSDSTHCKVWWMMGREGFNNRYLGTDRSYTWDDPNYVRLHKMYSFFGHRHRIVLADGRENSDQFTSYVAPYYTGEGYSPANGYMGPGEGIGNSVYSIGTYSLGNTGDDPLKTDYTTWFYWDDEGLWQSQSDWWESWFRANAPSTFRFKYMIDEIAVSSYEASNYQDQMTATETAADWVRQGSFPGNTLHLGQTKERIVPELENAIDLWIVSGAPSIDVDTMYYQRNVNNKTFCMYNGSRPFSAPMEVIDNYPTDNRVNPWIMWKDTISMCFEWATNEYASDDLSDYGWNIWESPYAVNLNTLTDTVWGGGNLIYCGEDVLYPEDSRGLAFPIATIRMKNIRRGIQDFEYMWLAKKDGLSSTVFVADTTIVPAAFNEAPNGGRNADNRRQPYWCQDPYKFERVRQNLAKALDPSAGTISQQNLKADIKADSILFNWTAVPNVSSYNLYRNGGYLKTITSTQTTASDALSALLSNSKLRYSLIPFDGAGQSMDSLRVDASIPSAVANSDTAWSGAVYLHSSVTISSGKTVTVQPGTNVVADTGYNYQILVNGTLRAAGKSGSPITFKARYSKAYGQRWNGISDTAANGKIILDSVIIRDATSGIYAAGSNDTIQRSTLINNYNGVNLNGSGLTLSNVIIDSSRYGIYSYYASPKILNSTIRRCYDGMYILGGSPGPGIYKSTITACTDYGIYGSVSGGMTTRPVSQSDSGRNVISKNQSGIYMGPNATFFFGNSSGYGAYNSIDSSTYGCDFYILTGATMTAEYNFWGGSPRFYFGQPPTWFDSTHALRSDPNPGRLGKMDAGGAPIPSTDSLELAYEKLSGGDYQGALSIYSSIFRSDPASMRGRRALLGIIQTFEQSNRADFLAYLQQNVQSLVSAQPDYTIILKQAQARWYAKTGRPTDAIALLQSLRKDYGSTYSYVEKYSLFEIGVQYLNELSDVAQARSSFALLQTEFPYDQLSDIGTMLLALGPMPSLKKAPWNGQDGPVETPKSFNLAQNYPNPFNPSTTIKYSLPEPGNVSLEVYDILGARVAVLASGPQNPGSYTTVWDARRFGSGVYFVRLTVQNDLGMTSYSKTNKILLLK